MPTKPNDVCVIIPAWNAKATIERAIVSAAAQPEVVEIVIVDDASTDGTLAVARAAAATDPRITVIAQERNRGPAAARNIGLAHSDAPYIALLDSDDFYLPERFAPMFAAPGWDAILDNIAFIPEEFADSPSYDRGSGSSSQPERLSLASFIAGNISRRGKHRAELGFAKPLIRRQFLADHALRYDETLRLGEDYALYARMLARGGRFLMIRSCGYVAVERRLSLSGAHKTSDLASLLASDIELEKDTDLPAIDRAILARHRRQIAAKLFHRAFLDRKQAAGLWSSFWLALGEPARLPGLVSAILIDKLAPDPKPDMAIRYLF